MLFWLSFLVGYIVARRFFTRTIALLFVVLLALSAWEVEYARAALYFAPLQLAYVAGIFLFYRTFFEEKAGSRKWALAVFLITPLVHQLGVGLWFCFPALVLIKGWKRFIKKDVFSFFIITTLFFALIQIHEYFFWKVGYVYERTETSLLGMIRYFFSGFSFDYFKELSWSFPLMSLFVVGGLFLCLGIRAVRSKQPDPVPTDFDSNWLYLNFCLFFPLLFLGFFRTHVQPRYLFPLYPLFALLFLVCLYKVSQLLVDLLVTPFAAIRKEAARSAIAFLLFAALLLVLTEGVGWKRVKSIVDRQYGDPIRTDIIARSGRPAHEDHKDPGEYVRHYLKDGDIVIAIHVVFSYIYAGRVDYWLWTGGPGTWDAWEETAQGWKDFYVGAKWIRDLGQLQKTIDDNPARRIWLITCPSILKKEHIKPEIAAFIRGQTDKLVFRGKDGTSEVYLWHDSERELTGPEHTFEGEWYPKDRGRIAYDLSASKGSALYLDKAKDRGKPLTVILDRPLSAGMYKLVLRARSAGSKIEGKALDVKVLFKKNKEKIFNWAVRGEEFSNSRRYQELQFEFPSADDDAVRIRLTPTGRENLWLDYLDIIPVKSEAVR